MQNNLIAISVFLLIFANSAVARAGEVWEQTGLKNNRIKVLETTPWGIIAGEYDTRLWLNPNNGLFITKNLGLTWSTTGLEKRGITDISYSSDKIYVSTYYFEKETAGFFVSSDGGNTWAHKGNNFSASTVSASENIVVLGTYSHGLWISNDYGNSWEQVFGDGFFGPEILETDISNKLLIASTTFDTYVSNDQGQTWEEVEKLKGKHIKSLEIVQNIVFAGTVNNEGMYRSNDLGKTWEALPSWGDRSVGDIRYFDNVLYASKKDPLTLKSDVYKSEDYGDSWVQTNLSSLYNEGPAESFTFAVTNPNHLFAAIPIEGVYKLYIQKAQTERDPLFQIPWETSNRNDLIQKIFSYFDHSYPLLNYPYFVEPEEEKNTTLNFLGIKKGEPQMYYSSHDGYDYVLEYGTPVLAVAPGFASYEYSDEKGNTIIIDHQNGYQTKYSHLQDESLITKDVLTYVSTETKIGLVGLTGITTGSHLHFSVTKGGNLKRVDPYGWQADKASDPWENFVWTDEAGTHNGMKSIYLWKYFPEKVAKYFDYFGGEVSLDNKKIIVDQNSSEQGFTVFVEPFEIPKVPLTQNRLTYVTGSSILANIYNILGEEIPILLKPVKIEMDFSNADVSNILANTISFYFWNETKEIWEKIDSVYEVSTKRLTGETYHLSHIAAFGTKIKKKVKVEGAVFKISQ